MTLIVNKLTLLILVFKNLMLCVNINIDFFFKSTLFDQLITLIFKNKSFVYMLTLIFIKINIVRLIVKHLALPSITRDIVQLYHSHSRCLLSLQVSSLPIVVFCCLHSQVFVTCSTAKIKTLTQPNPIFPSSIHGHHQPNPKSLSPPSL